MTATTEQRAERQRLGAIAAENAKRLLKPGDRLRVTKCPGTKRTITFVEFSGQWIVSRSGADDYHPINVSHVNGLLVDFTRSELPL